MLGLSDMDPHVLFVVFLPALLFEFAPPGLTLQTRSSWQPGPSAH
jgi:hypothetical protein